MLLDIVRTGLVYNIRRERRLLLRGEVLVNEGEEVRPEDVVAETHLPGAIFMLDIARGLDIDPADVKHFLVRQPGDFLMEDDVIAQDDGTFSRVIRTPMAGRFIGVHQGQALLEVSQDTIQVQACMVGTVEAVVPEYGAMISSTGLLIQGVWGNGGMGEGKLTVIEESWSAPLKKSMVAEVENGQVVAAGQCFDGDAIKLLAEVGSAGLISGVLAPGLIQVAAALPSLPVIVLQCFGQLSADSSILEMLKAHAGKVVDVHAATANRLTGIRPEVIVPQAGEAQSAESSVLTAIATGQRVRLYSGKAQGQSGKVLAFVDEPPLFDSGLRFPAVVVELDDGEKITVPQQNLVILG